MAESKEKPRGRKWLPQMAALLKACADQTRLRLLNLLACEGEVCVCHLVDVLGANQPKVSRHLAYLKRAGLVSDRKEGLWVYYRLSTPLAEHSRRLIECLGSCCAETPEMQRDVAKLRQVKSAQPVIKLARRSRSAAKPDTAEVALPVADLSPANPPTEPSSATALPPSLEVELL
jgi:ArsR family transcriptional regulator